MGVLARKMEEEYTGRTEHLDKTRTKAHLFADGGYI